MAARAVGTVAAAPGGFLPTAAAAGTAGTTAAATAATGVGQPGVGAGAVRSHCLRATAVTAVPPGTLETVEREP